MTKGKERRVRFEGVPVYRLNFGAFRKGAAMTIPGIGIFVGKENSDNRTLLRHEFGHILQYRKWGFRTYWRHVATVSLRSARAANRGSGTHKDSWAEWSANRLAYAYFGEPADWDLGQYPIIPSGKSREQYPRFAQNVSDFSQNWLEA